MTPEALRTFCLSFPQSTEDIKWEHHLCFCIAEKMFAVANVEPSDDHFVALKSTPEKAAELIETEGIIPTPYMARNHWITLQRPDVLRDAEMKELIRESYALIVSKLPKRTQMRLAGGDSIVGKAWGKRKPALAKKKTRRPAKKRKRSR